MNFVRETLSAVKEEIQPLLEKHWKEIALYPDILLNPDWERYAGVEEHGALRIYTIRNDGTLVGYAVFFVLPSPHYKDSLQAGEDILFLDASLRGHFVGVRFMKFCEEELTKEGVQVVRHHTKAKFSFAPLLEHLGYELEDLVYAKRLDKRELKVDTMKIDGQM